MQAILCHQYLTARGITDDTVRMHGLELHGRIDRKVVKARLSFKLANGYSEIIWIPVPDSQGGNVSYIARPLPTIDPKRKFLCPLGSTGEPFIPQSVYQLAYGQPVILTEAPIKALACLQAGVTAIGLNGVYGASVKNADDNFVIRADLLAALDWRGRKVYLAFDADCATNPDVRQALIRLFFIMSSAGAEVYQLTNWDQSQGKGIDDYLVGQLQSNGQHPPAEVMARLLTDAKPFIQTLQKTPVDLGLICSELTKVQLFNVLRSQLCRDLAKQLGVNVDDLRGVAAAKPATSSPAYATDPNPWPDPVVDGESLLHAISAIIRRYVVLNELALSTATLWVALAYLSDAVDILPILAITSPEKRCGKTSLLGVLNRLVRRPLPAANISSASIYRSIDQFHPTLLIDEADTFLKDNEELRGVINSGHTRDTAFVLRVNRETSQLEVLPTWAPKAIALIGKLPDTLTDRSLVLAMTRRKKGEKIEKLRTSSPVEFEELRRRLMRWTEDNKTAIASANPQIPQNLNDRAGDNWFPLLAIAQTAGQTWITIALKTIAALPGDDDEDSVSTMLLLSLRNIFQPPPPPPPAAPVTVTPAPFISSEDIVKELNADKAAPWADWRKGAGITVHKLGRMLKEFGVKPFHNQTLPTRPRGYLWTDLEPVFDTCLSSTSP